MYRFSYNYNQICYNNKRKDGKSKDGPCVNQAPLFESANYVADLIRKSVDLFQLFKSEDGKKFAPLFRQYLAAKNIKSLNEFKQVFRNVTNPNVSIHLIGDKQRCYIKDLPAALGIDGYVYIKDFKDFEKFSILFETITASQKLSRSGNPTKVYRYTGDNPILRKLSGENGISQVEWSKILDYGGLDFINGVGELKDQFFKPSNAGDVYIGFSNLNNRIKGYAHIDREQFTKLSPEEQKQKVVNDILDAAYEGNKTRKVDRSQSYIRYTISPDDNRYVKKYAELIFDGRRADIQGLTQREWAQALNISERDVNAFYVGFLQHKSAEDKDKIFSNALFVNYIGPKYTYTGNEPLAIEKIKKAQNELKAIYNEDPNDPRIIEYVNNYNFLDEKQKQKRISDYLSGGFKQSDFIKIFDKSYPNVRQIFRRSGQTQAEKNYDEVIRDINSNADSLTFIEQNRQELTNLAIEKLAGVKHKFNMEQLLQDEFATYNKDGITFHRQELVRYQLPGDNLISWVFLDGVFKKNGKIILAVECQGQQHYQYIQFNKIFSYDDWLNSIKRDRVKLSFCHDFDIPLIYVSRYLDNEHIKLLFKNLNSNLNYYASQVPTHPDLSNFVFVPNQNPEDVEQEVQLYSDRIVGDHLSLIRTELYKDISEQVKLKFLKDKLIALSKLVMLFEKSLSDDEKEFIKSFTYETDLSRGYEFVRRSFEKLSNNPIDFHEGINFGMIQSKNVLGLNIEAEDVEELKEQRKLEKIQGRVRPPRQRNLQNDMIPVPDELMAVEGLKPEDPKIYIKLVREGKSPEEALRIILERINGRKLRSEYNQELLRRGFNIQEQARFYSLVGMGKTPQEAMDEISSRMKRKRDYSYREELIGLGFKPFHINQYDKRVNAGEDPELVKSDILQKIQKKKKEVVEYAFGRDKKKRYRIKIINKKRSGVAMKKTLGNIVRIANLLDSQGLHNEADKLTRVAVKLAQNFNDEFSKYEMRTQRDYDSSQDDGFESDDDYAELETLENDPLFIRYKMEYQKDPMAEGDEELEDLVKSKLASALAGTYLQQSVDHGDSFYIMEDWLNDEKSLIQSAYDYEMSLRDHLDDYPNDDYDPLDD